MKEKKVKTARIFWAGAGFQAFSHMAGVDFALKSEFVESAKQALTTPSIIDWPIWLVMAACCVVYYFYSTRK